ncbi:MAG: hypothetical protein WDZ69_02160 [Candidatus Pacearchaeota archaeon]
MNPQHKTNNPNKFTPLKILNKHEKEEIEKSLNEQFGIKKVEGIIVQKGKERLFLFTGSFNEKGIKKLEEDIIIERTGIYFAKIVPGENAIKLSIEGTQFLKDQIKKNTFSLNSEQAKKWMEGSELQIKTGKRGFLAIKHGPDFLGVGKASEEKIGNFIPKSRRLRVRGS